MVDQASVFISDVHLGAFNKEKEVSIEQNLISLIDYCSQHNIKIYILGDLFDYWMEYTNPNIVPSISEAVIQAFKTYNSQVMPATFITGNHDNWDFGYFASIGFDVEPNFRIVEFNGTHTLLMHGDGKYRNEDSLKRPLFHRMLRNPTFIKWYQKLFPAEIGITIMKGFSKLSKFRESRNATGLNAHAQQILDQNNFDVVLMGHDHVPRVETFSNGLYINLGTFYEHQTLVIYTKNQFNLVKWSGSTKEFVPFTEF